MTTIPNFGYFQRNGKIEIAADDYTAGISSFALIPTTPTATHVDIGGGVQAFAGATTWQAQITFSQDWTTPESLSKKAIEWAGLKKTLKYTPTPGAEPVTIEVTFQPAQIGGGSGQIATATLNLMCTGQPVFGAGA